MIEIESSEIIASYAIYSKDRVIRLEYKKINRIASVLSKSNEPVFANCDKISIDAFHCSFPQNIILKDKYVEIKNSVVFRQRIKRYALPQHLLELVKSEFEN